ncbi:MAG: hypothetical protein U0359_10255 [Byssovorax sp.]
MSSRRYEQHACRADPRRPAERRYELPRDRLRLDPVRALWVACQVAPRCLGRGGLLAGALERDGAQVVGLVGARIAGV